MSNIHLYSDVVLSNVTSVLWNIKERGGLASNKFLMSEQSRLQGSWAVDSINIALVVMGRNPVFEGVASERQMSIFVEQAEQQNEGLLHQIARLRAAKGK